MKCFLIKIRLILSNYFKFSYKKLMLNKPNTTSKNNCNEQMDFILYFDHSLIPVN